MPRAKTPVNKNNKKQDSHKTFDMYHFFSRKDMIMVIAFIVAFLIFSLAILLMPQAV